ncbi:hypothetical protein BCR33DRAFT_316368 [Rhizoclosmatium globosum]|uniref:Uncharacterized protein n=1 Tax=Rhizoclosmatium globosum TaxID=329046 RepID=A0A1Y2CZC0_9FUNG|nr:hypothetical protein BCR33DRAFT_316368 [Rhizoclosmatium globosum]|eukprot:ORY52371.1 hypothetical protein BCR33DRAFT_316368 [Rhizoclosmatium globosum]
MSNEVYFDFREDETVEEEIMPFDLPINSRSFEVPARTRASTASDESDTIYIPDRCESLNRRSVKTYSTYMRGSTSVSLDRTLRSASQPPLSRSTSTPMRRVLEEEPPATSTSTLNVENERIESRGRSRSRKIRDNWRQTMDRTLDRMKRSFSSFGSLGRKGMTTEFVNKREFMADDAILQELHINSQTEEERFPLANVEFNKPTRKSKSAGILGGHEKREPPALHTR